MADIVVSSVGIQGVTTFLTTNFNLEQVQNIDTTNLTTGALLVYNAATANWEATKNLQGQNIDSGEF